MKRKRKNEGVCEMIKVIHGFIKMIMAVWTGFSILVAVLDLVAAWANPDNGGVFFGVLVIIFFIWLLPMLFFILVAYFTRPQAWAENTQPSAIPESSGEITV